MKKIYLIFIINLLLLDLLCLGTFVKIVSCNEHGQSDNSPISKVINNICEIKVGENKTSMGTGIYIGDNKILTCNHLVEKTKENIIKAKFYQSNGWQECKVIRASKKDDLLLLSLNKVSYKLKHLELPINKGFHTFNCIKNYVMATKWLPLT